MTLNDPEVVRREYASEDGLQARRSVYGEVSGPNAWDGSLAAVREVAPSRVLEVGCGWGDFAARVAGELGAEVVAVDISPRMVELARERGIDARVADAQALPFADGEFDCVVANWMLYHVPDLDLALAEIARVLRPGGTLVATANLANEHLVEVWRLVGRDRATEAIGFTAENGHAVLGRRFVNVERRDYRSPVTFADTAAVRARIESSIAHKHLAAQLPELEEPLVATRAQVVFVAEVAV